jgi:hypothetical protein
MNRTGDWLLSISFFALFALFGSLDYSLIFNLTPFLNETGITIIALLLFGGACAKSAQIPFHSWLPGSMEGFLKYFLLINICLFLYCFNFFIYYFNFLNDFTDILFYNLCFVFPKMIRNKSDQSINRNEKLISKNLVNALIGELLGDGHLRFTHKDKLDNVSGNAHFAITLKNYDYALYLKDKIYFSICTLNPIRAWPNPKTGKTPTQYNFLTKSLISLTEIHKQWYYFNKETNKFVKIVPLNINELLTPIG